MKNPFKYGGIVTGRTFCNRTREQRDIRRVIENNGRMFLYSERRMGKTSLIKKVLDDLPQKRFISVYIDLWPTDTTRSCITVIAKALSEAIPGRVGKIVEFTKAFFSQLRPSVSLNEEGKPIVSFGIQQINLTGPDILSVLSAPEKIAKQYKRTLIVIFDEFQRINEYEDDLFERQLRSVIQNHSNVCYLFLGSRKHLIKTMFLEESRPLYRSAEHYPIFSISENSWYPFLTENFSRTGKSISPEAIHHLIKLTDGHPFYVQHIAHILWEQCEDGGMVKAEDLDPGITLLLEREQYAYTVLWESFTTNQRRFLIGLAMEPRLPHVFSGDFLKRYVLVSASTVQRIVGHMLSKDIIDHEMDSFIISDRFFRMWITKQYKNQIS